ncbi:MULTISPECIES: ABC transporter permease subunit [Rhizobium]|uniref:Oligopeptide transport system permease protein OppC n=1 Tax=Rhizobium rhododendri TaxID=2506430 RepID=A0ABY8IEP9_9HYPH|nr:MULTISPECIES: ABC transporter permease subunit [Rhizobium]MBZ5758748.1 ABC transporter permease subunit [Rhizobium sp. VS19-DR96]MBZ5764422.1 ABC transporter permease subunit [Rhizobium sp. VS19-DR129.2]MBZ5771965.1 ABC transporter permease subunit [Rhizobium sp. VS19-DRK62.2]MBZ5783348.1 ABC transporter permease subunit [Rhizobium sp. VS19-DR121]MBZ5800796.1 ABC transporter permease subunit [Rhizobium sp. VS19-DR181]
MILNLARREQLEEELRAAEGLAPESRSLTRDAMRRLLRNKAAAISLVVLTLLILAALIAPALIPYGYEDPDWAAFRTPPDFASGHYFGTDQNGRDLLARTLYGTRVSLAVALVATLVSVIIGVLYGAVSGYFGGKLDSIMMRFVDIMYALPYILFVILLMVIFGRNVYLLFAAIGALEWLTMARIVRGQTLSLKHREFIEAARASGQRPFKIILKHIVPNLVGPVVIYAALTVPEIIATESFLSYLGFGVQEPLTSLGTLIADGTNSMETDPWLLAFPAVFLVALLMSLLFIGDGLRDAFDPKDR